MTIHAACFLWHRTDRATILNHELNQMAGRKICCGAGTSIESRLQWN